MTDEFRKLATAEIARELAGQIAGFERLGYRLMEVIHPAHWSERGTTIQGASRGYTVDCTAAASSLVAEMSGERDYFSKDLKKPKRDLQHAITQHPNATRIWLLAGQETPPGMSKKIGSLRDGFLKEHPGVDGIEILDGRTLANVVYDNLESERFVGAVAPFLPSVGRLADEYAFSHRVPRFPSYRRREALEETISAALADSQQVVLRGVSGIGKSALAAKVADDHRSHFASIIWVDAHELKDTSALSSIDVHRTGVRHNLLAILRRRKCLLILDDARFETSELERLNLGSSSVIVTCQASGNPKSILVGDLSPDAAKDVLSLGVASPCPPEVFRAVITAVGGHALLLHALNQIAMAEGWTSVAACCHDATNSLEDDRHQKVCKRILARHLEALEAELAFVRWVDQPRISRDLISACVSSNAVRNLEKRGFLAATTYGHIRVHDVVFVAIREVVAAVGGRSENFLSRFEKLIEQHANAEDHVVRRIAALHVDLIVKNIHQGSRPSLVYALTVIRDPELPLSLLGDPVSMARELVTLNGWHNRDLEFRTVIEVVEAIYTVESAKDGTQYARKRLSDHIQALDWMLRVAPANSLAHRDLCHHYAKMLARLGRTDEAISRFERLVGDDQAFAAARLQLGRLYAKQKKVACAIDQCKAILQTSSQTHEVSVHVLLGALELLAREGRPTLLASYTEVILGALNAARESDASLAAKFVSGVCSKVWFHLPEVASDLYDRLNWSLMAPTRNDELFDIAQAHKAAGKARKDVSLLAKSKTTYEAMTTRSPYETVHYAEVLIRLEDWGLALASLDTVPVARRDTFWNLRAAQALVGLGSHERALDTINKGIETLNSTNFRSTFLAVKANALRGLGKTQEARECIIQAIDDVPANDPYAKELLDFLATVEDDAV